MALASCRCVDGRCIDIIHADDGLDPLLRMAITHHQFESIHPFYDGNGRTGRILNLLMSQRDGLLDLPVRYLSRYITTTKHDVRERLPKLYSQDLLNNLFRYPYTKIEFVENERGVFRPTAGKYLEQLL